MLNTIFGKVWKLSRDPSLEILLPRVLEVVHILQLGAIKIDGWFRSVSLQCSLMKDFNLAKADSHPKQFQCLREFVKHKL